MNDDGIETIAQTKSPTGESVPLMAADQKRLESIIALGKAIANAYHKKLTVVEFSNRSDVGEFNQ